MTQEKLIDRIKKLLAMANNNDNSNEADIAMRRANKLLKDNDLNMLSLHEVSEEKVGSAMQDFVRPWTRAIYSGVSELYDCTYFVTHRFSDPYHVVVGNENNRVTATIIAEQLVDIIRKESVGKGNGFRNSAGLAIFDKCKEIIEENKANQEEVTPGTGIIPMDISKMRQSANDAHCEEKFSIKKKQGSRLVGNSAGREFGSGLSVNIRMSNKRALN